MNVPLEAVIFIATLLVALIGWLAQRSISSTDRDVLALEQWRDDHEKESNVVRRQIERDLAENAAAIKVNASQYAEILRRLSEIDSKIGRIETRDEN